MNKYSDYTEERVLALQANIEAAVATLASPTPEMSKPHYNAFIVDLMTMIDYCLHKAFLKRSVNNTVFLFDAEKYFQQAILHFDAIYLRNYLDDFISTCIAKAKNTEDQASGKYWGFALQIMHLQKMVANHHQDNALLEYININTCKLYLDWYDHSMLTRYPDPQLMECAYQLASEKLPENHEIRFAVMKLYAEIKMASAEKYIEVKKLADPQEAMDCFFVAMKAAVRSHSFDFVKEARPKLDRIYAVMAKLCLVQAETDFVQTKNQQQFLRSLDQIKKLNGDLAETPCANLFDVKIVSIQLCRVLITTVDENLIDKPLNALLLLSMAFRIARTNKDRALIAEINPKMLQIYHQFCYHIVKMARQFSIKLLPMMLEATSLALPIVVVSKSKDAQLQEVFNRLRTCIELCGPHDNAARYGLLSLALKIAAHMQNPTLLQEYYEKTLSAASGYLQDYMSLPENVENKIYPKQFIDQMISNIEKYFRTLPRETRFTIYERFVGRMCFLLTDHFPKEMNDEFLPQLLAIFEKQDGTKNITNLINSVRSNCASKLSYSSSESLMADLEELSSSEPTDEESQLPASRKRISFFDSEAPVESKSVRFPGKSILKKSKVSVEEADALFSRP